MTTDTTQQNHSEYSEWTAGYLASQTEKYDRFGVGRLYIDITGHLTDGIIFSRLMYWFTPSKKGNPRTKVSRDGHRWVARNYDQWWEECRIDARAARASVKRMVDSGLLIKAVFKFGKKPTTHLRINWQTFEKLAKEHLAISLEDKRSLKRSKRQKMTERAKSVMAKNDGTMVVAKNDETKFRQKMSEPSSMITESLTTTLTTSLQLAAGASVAGAPEVAAKAVMPETKQESIEPSAMVKDTRYHKFTSYWEEVEPGTYITHAYSLDNMMERCACGKPIEGLLTLADIPPAHTLHACKRCLGVVEANRATLTMPDEALTNRKNLPPGAVLAAAAKKPKAPKEHKPPDAIFKWICDYLKVDAEVAWTSNRHLAHVLTGYIVREEKHRLKLDTKTPLNDEQRTACAKRLPGFIPWYQRECKDCSLPKQAQTFEIWIGRWFKAGGTSEPDSDWILVEVKNELGHYVERTMNKAYLSTVEWRPINGR